MTAPMNSELLDHWASAVRVTAALVDTREDAEDCASAAVLQLLERGSDAIDNPQAFLFTVAKRRAADKARSNTRARRRDVRLAGQPPAAIDVAEDVAARAEARWVAQVARERLSPKAFLLLRLLADGHDIADAAAMLGITQRGAESLLLRARRTVRQAWSKTLALLGGFLMLGRRLRITAPAVTLAASVLVVAADLHVGTSLPQPATSHAAPPAHARSIQPMQLLGESRFPPGASRVTPRAASRHVAPAAPTSNNILDVRPPTGGHATIRSEQRPGGSGDRLDTIQRCLHDFRVTVEHIGC